MDYARAAETIFARSEDTWSAGDWSILRRVGPHPGGTPSHDRSRFNDWLRREQARHTVIREQQGRCGSSGDREQARQRAEQAAAELAHRAPEIEAQIAALQSELATIARDAKLATDAVARQTAAVVALRDEERLTLLRIQAGMVDAAIPLSARRFPDDVVRHVIDLVTAGAP